MADNIKYEITKFIGTISERNDGYGNRWTREVNLVAWNGRDAKVDIREWNADHSRMSKGITLTREEAEVLYMRLDGFLKEGKE